MNTQEIEIDVTSFDKNSGDLEYLSTAIEKLSTKTEKEFEELKNEKWFTRVIDFATFSKKKDIRVSSQISNVSQAQDILVELLRHLSNKDVEIDDMLLENVEDVERLYGHTEKLALKVQDLKKQLVLGINQSKTIDHLQEHEKEIAALTIQSAASYFEQTSEAQKNFAHDLLNYLKTANADGSIEKAIPKIDSLSSRKVILQLLMEYGYLHSLNFDFDKKFEEIVDLFDFGNKTINELKNKIENIHHLRGEEGFSWFASDDVENTFELEFDNDVSIILENPDDLNQYDEEAISDMEIDLDAPKEEYQFDKITTVEKEEDLTISNKVIDVDMILKVEGKLNFINCDLTFPEEFASITLSGGELIFNHCNINADCENDAKKFISDEKNQHANLKFYNSEIHNKYSFIDHDFLSVDFHNSKIVTTYDTFIYCKDLSFSFSEFRIEEKAEVKYQTMMTFKSLDLIESSFTSDSINKDVMRIFNGTGTNEEEKINCKLCEFRNLYSVLTRGSKIEIIDCVFKDCEDIFDYSAEIMQSAFYDCNSIVDSYSVVDECEFFNCNFIVDYGIDNEIKNSSFFSCDTVLRMAHSLLTHCNFENCIDINLSDNNNVEHCTFDNIQSLFNNSGSNNVRDCEFHNIYLKSSDDFSESSLIQYSYHDKSFSNSEVSNCLFQNIIIEKSKDHYFQPYVIKATCSRNIKSSPLRIRNCAFVDCKSDKELVYLTDYYYPRFSKKSKTVKLGTIENTVGLEG